MTKGSSRPPMPQQLQALDTPSDGGGRLTVLWAPSTLDGPDLRYQVLIQEGPPPADPSHMKVLAEFPSNTHYVTDSKQPWWTRHDGAGSHAYQIGSGRGVEVKNGVLYSIAVASVQGGQRVFAPPVEAVASPNWFNWNALNNLIIALSFGLLVLYTIRRAHRGRTPRGGRRPQLLSGRLPSHSSKSHQRGAGSRGGENPQ